MKTLTSRKAFSPTRIALAVAASLSAGSAFADAVTDWNLYTALATKGATSKTTGAASAALNSNVATRVAAIEARAVFDAVNAIKHFSKDSYYYSGTHSAAPTANSASAAAAQAAHDVLFALQTNVNTRAWLDDQLASDLAALGINSATDPGVIAGRDAAAAALAARNGDNSAIRTGYIPTSNISATGAPNATGNPGIGLWRPSNGAAGVVDANTGAPTGFDGAGAILPTAAIDFNWKNVTPFSLTTREKQELVAAVPPSLKVGGAEYNAELDFVKNHGQDFANPGSRSDDQLLQALYYKSDAELFTNEAARIGSKARGFTLEQNARLFAALDSALADARIGAWQSKYDLVFWRPVTAINADGAGAATTYDWKPLGTTPSHPSSTGGHSSTVSAGAEILRAFFHSDNIVPGNTPVTLTGLPWLVGTNNGTGKLQIPVDGQDGTFRKVSTLTQLQLENGRSRIYLGVHYGNDDFQGQSLGLSVADAILEGQKDPAVKGVAIYPGNKNVASAGNLRDLFVNNSDVSGFFGLDEEDREGKDEDKDGHHH
ncbi:MAG: vanadium-dependent haloperoxidase [Methylomonas sp.]